MRFECNFKIKKNVSMGKIPPPGFPGWYSLKKIISCKKASIIFDVFLNQSACYILVALDEQCF